LHFSFTGSICTFKYNHLIEPGVKGHKVASQTSNLWTKLQGLICFDEFAKNAKNIIYEKYFLCFTKKISDGSNGDVAKHQYHKH
jgi:hypothetical protein